VCHPVILIDSPPPVSLIFPTISSVLPAGSSLFFLFPDTLSKFLSRMSSRPTAYGLLCKTQYSLNTMAGLFSSSKLQRHLVSSCCQHALGLSCWENIPIICVVWTADNTSLPKDGRPVLNQQPHQVKSTKSVFTGQSWGSEMVENLTDII
jgi:hypothetical protein